MRPSAGAEPGPARPAAFARLPAVGPPYFAPRSFFDRHLRLLDYAAAARGLRLEGVSFRWLADRLHPLEVRIEVLPSPRGDGATVELSAVRAQLPGELTARELQILTLVAAGLTNPDIAQRLGVSRRTVATHVERILAKLGVSTRTAAGALAVDQGLLVLPIPGGPHGVVPLDVARLDLAVAG